MKYSNLMWIVLREEEYELAHKTVIHTFYLEGCANIIKFNIRILDNELYNRDDYDNRIKYPLVILSCNDIDITYKDLKIDMSFKDAKKEAIDMWKDFMGKISSVNNLE